MNIVPLDKEIYETAIKLGVTEIRLQFWGGNDEGNLNVSLAPYSADDANFEQQVTDWAYEAYSYSGAGDGSEYGDNITYDLVNKRAKAESFRVWARKNATRCGE